MKPSSRNKNIQLLYLEPYTFSVVAGNDTLIYNSLNGKILEYRDSSFITEVIRKTEDAGCGFLAEIDLKTVSKDVSSLINDLRETFSGDLLTSVYDQKPSVVRPKPVINNYPPAKDFPSFSVDDYLRNIYFFLNEDNNTLCTDYSNAANQFFCPVYNSSGYNEMPFATVFDASSMYAGMNDIALDLSGSDLTRYSEINDMLAQINKLLLPVNFHLPLPCRNDDKVWKMLQVRNSRISFYVTFPDGLSALDEILKNSGFDKKRKKIDISFLVQSLEEYRIITEFMQGYQQLKVFFLPYFNGSNTEFFEENVFLAKNDILNLKPDQQQIFSRSLINEQLFGKLYINTRGEAYTNLNGNPVGNIYNQNISDLVRNELYNGQTWSLTRMKVKPCSDCLYKLFCPPVGYYELFMKKFNFCDVL